ncbi:MAG: YebC/PmpR family DNA-binding transcriptional regulator [Anaerolineaceae bacterium]|nr:YebC/PmpR family DNA-binding transcriptional regulator [Anaerolineaceae bacterium]
MAGHSHWSQIKRKKAGVDARRGAQFSKVTKLITVATRQGGADLSMNLTLRYAIDKARSINMPRDNIERAVKKGTGELAGAAEIKPLRYEAYVPGGVAVMIDCLSDNRNRTAGEVRNILEKHGGSLAATNSVAHMFQRKGAITISEETAGEDQVMEIALEYGADDVTTSDGLHEITCGPEAFEELVGALEKAGIKPDRAVVEPVPHTTVPLDAVAARKVLKVMDLLEEHDDVSEVYANFDIADQVMAEIEKG